MAEEQGLEREQPFDEGQMTDEELSALIEKLCMSKAEEFHMLGYEQVTGAEVWSFVSDKYKSGIPPLHRMVNDIMSLKVTSFMNWMTMNAFRGIE
ncbi:post-transcriptional regulator [Paenibacillus turpanensis]|uniref:post-transcriptional regulator n=1 Tax=Paenibacillus turpanensis TaxID=2689078 RepID=UPI001FB76403|nr:post-transcriptional regulator [Paenibacillus turpanensis]